MSYLLVFICAINTIYAQCPTITNTNPSICDASGFTFNDLNAFATDNGNGITWYSAAIGGTSFNSNQLVSQTTYYADDNSGVCGTRESITVDFQVNPTGQNLQGIFCSNENPTIQTYIDIELQPNAPEFGTVEVYTDINLTNQAGSSDPIPNGATNYYIVFVNSTGCKSQIEAGSTALFEAPQDPAPANPQEFCSDTNPTVADLDAGTAENFNWYANIDGNGDVVLPALNNALALVDGNTYYVQVEGFFCDSNPVQVTAFISDPFDPGISSTLEYCEDNVPTTDFDLFDELGGMPDTVGTWTGPLATSNGHLGTVNISSLTTPGIYTFTYTVPANGACPEDIATITITIYEIYTSGVPSASNPATFCEATLPSSFDLFSLLDNEDPNGQWTQGTASTDPVVTSPIDLSGLTSGTYDFTYTQNVLPNLCPEESTTVQVVVLQDPNAGNAVNQLFCENDLGTNSPFDLFTALDGSQDNNLGVWTDANDVIVTNPIDISGFTVAGSPYQFTYTIDGGTCSDSEIITITVSPAPESGTPVSVFPEFCEGTAPASFDLFDLLDNEDQTGTWYIGTDNTGATTANPVDLSGLTPGTYDYTFDVDAIGSCDDELVTVSVTINALPETGTANNPPPFCENDPALNNTAFDLFTLLGAPFDAGGIWTDDNASGALTGNTLDLTQLTVGAYNFTYDITDANSCSSSTTVTIVIDDAPESGTPVSVFPEFCEGTAPASFDLFDLLDNEDQTGTWYIGTDNTGATTANPVDLSGLTPGTYDYTFDVDAIGSCDDELVTVSVTINALPETGTANNPPPFCENDPALNNTAFDLFTLLGAPFDAGGIWTDDNASGALTGNTLDLTQLTVGAYNFTYDITDANSCSSSTTVTIVIDDAPESGSVNNPAPFCVSDITTAQTIDLFDLLDDEDQTGTWSDDSSSGALSGNIVTIDGLSAGIYNFTFDVDAIGSCDDELVTVSVEITDTPTPLAAVIQEFCDLATIGDLLAAGTTIQWYDEAVGGIPLTNDIVLVDGETYYATQTDATTGCESSFRFEVTVTIYQTPNSGNPSTNPIFACNDNNAIDLNTGLDGTQDTGGTWQDTDATGALSGSTFDATGIVAGTYNFTYLVSASAPCSDASTVITVTIDNPLNAGNDAVLDVCSDNGTTDLFTLLGTADIGGTWSPALASGTGVFDPLVDTSATYTYLLTNACGNSSSNVVVTVTQAANAGTDASISICVIDGSIDLFNVLGGTPDVSGTWSPTLTSGTGVFDPLVDTAGTYVYSVTATAPCTTNAAAQVTVTVNNSTAPTVVDANPSYCLVDNPTVADLDATVSATGTITWYDTADLTTALSNTEVLIDGEDYYATQTNGSGCESSVNVQINVTVGDASTPTLINVNQELCINDSPTINDLTLNISEYNSISNNVIWYNSATNGTIIDSTTELNPATTYYASLIDPITGCESSVRLAVSPDLTACGLLVIPDGFSPNGDGTNDTFDIDNLNVLYPNFEIEIFNRYGNIVYKGNASTPRFDGTSNQSRTIADGDLPIGVYYYIFNYNDGINKPKQGSLYLSR